jgi:hypothetical protein
VSRTTPSEMTSLRATVSSNSCSVRGTGVLNCLPLVFGGHETHRILFLGSKRLRALLTVSEVARRTVSRVAIRSSRRPRLRCWNVPLARRIGPRWRGRQRLSTRPRCPRRGWMPLNPGRPLERPGDPSSQLNNFKLALRNRSTGCAGRTESRSRRCLDRTAGGRLIHRGRCTAGRPASTNARQAKVVWPTFTVAFAGRSTSLSMVMVTVPLAGPIGLACKRRLGYIPDQTSNDTTRFGARQLWRVVGRFST